MSIEKKKKRKLSIGAAALAAGMAIGSQIPVKDGKASEDAIANFIQSDQGKFSEHNPKGEVVDRRDEPREIANALHFGELEPDPPINDELATSQLAVDLGVNNIGKPPEKSPLEIMRAQKARAAQLAKDAKAAWLRERNKKK